MLQNEPCEDILKLKFDLYTIRILHRFLSMGLILIALITCIVLCVETKNTYYKQERGFECDR